MLSDELELVKSLTSTLASFNEEPKVTSGGGRPKSDDQSHDRDVWTPPTPQEQVYVHVIRIEVFNRPLFKTRLLFERSLEDQQHTSI